jgi:hypothetical protein
MADPDKAGASADFRLYTWRKRESFVSMTVDDVDRVRDVTVRQTRGTTIGPGGIVLGQQSVRSAVKKLGRDWIAVSGVTCTTGEQERPEPILGFSIRCGAEDTVTAHYRVRITHGTKGVMTLCNTTPSLDSLVGIAGQEVIREVMLASTD